MLRGFGARIAPVAALVFSVALVGEASAVTQVIPGDGTDNTRKLTIYIGDNGQLQAKAGKQSDALIQGMFYGNDNGPASNYWHLRINEGPNANTTISPYDSSLIVPVSNGPVTGLWTSASPAKNVTVMDIKDPSNPNVILYRVRQTVLFVGFNASFRVVWDISAPSSPAPGFIFGTSADLFIDASDRGRGVFVAGAPNRFVGGTNEAGRVTGGLQEVAISGVPGDPGTPIPPWASFEEGQYSAVTGRLEGADSFLNTIEPNLIDNGVGVSWANRATTPLPIGQTQRYEVVWHLNRRTPLSASPSVTTKELGGQHNVVLQLVDSNFNRVPGAPIRYEIAGANPRASTPETTNNLGQVSIQWNGVNAGLDTLTAYVDADVDGIKDAAEAATGASVRWLANNRVVGPPAAPSSLMGGQVPITKQPNPANPEAPTFQVGSKAAAAAGAAQCSFDQRNGWTLNMPVTTTLNPAGGTISNVELFLADPGRHDPAAIPPTLPPAIGSPTQSGNSYTFTIPCVVTGQMWVGFTHTAGANIQTFVIPIGGLQLIDPQGVVFDGRPTTRRSPTGRPRSRRGPPRRSREPSCFCNERPGRSSSWIPATPGSLPTSTRR